MSVGVFALLKCMRLFRLGRLVKMMDKMGGGANVMGIVRILASLLLLAHIVGCGWMLLNRLQVDDGHQRWVDTMDLEGESVSHQYIGTHLSPFFFFSLSLSLFALLN